MKNVNYKEIIEVVCRLYVFFFLFAYGLAKVIGAQFYMPEAMPSEIESLSVTQLSNFDLAWVFMGRSYGYMLFIGLGEIIGALMLLFNKTKLIGAFVLIPIMVNVIVFDIFFLDEYGALASAIIYLILLLVMLWMNKVKVIRAFKILTHFDALPKTTLKHKLVKFSYVFLIIFIVFVFNQLMVSWLGYGKG
ncbi:MAG: hypothetical protein BM564_13055 [Bacteroidetes bacterium MedPE-SWsnd-G2]|nr:MAG: hypothetical protein BM564_13055 [Bacteroidetes bacterium MedPE-SWsnd-G2]